MDFFLFITLFLFDAILLWFLLKGKTKQVDTLDTLNLMNEERKMITDLHENIKKEMADLRIEIRRKIDHINHLATEIDQEIQSSKGIIQEECNASASIIKEMIGKPIEDLSKRYVSTKRLLTRIEKEKETITRVITKGEKICQFIDQRIPYEELLNDLEDKKYSDARALLALGKTPREVASHLGLTEGEVRLVAGLSI
jgi:hypothetical protein